MLYNTNFFKSPKKQRSRGIDLKEQICTFIKFNIYNFKLKYKRKHFVQSFIYKKFLKF